MAVVNRAVLAALHLGAGYLVSEDRSGEDWWQNCLVAFEMVIVGGIFFWGFVWMLFSRHATKLEWELERLSRVRAE